MSTEASKYYVLSMLSNLNSNFAAEKETELESNINRIDACLQEPELKEFLGDWKMAWGPFTMNIRAKNFIGTKFLTDHAMYLAFNEKKNTYFIGIAGTNSLSEKNWIQEDLNVEKMVDWLPRSGNSPMVAQGAMEGFQDLWMAEVEKKTVLGFLKDNIDVEDDTTVVVAGHSLGGCLTPLMASALAIEFADTEVKVEAYPTAGPTPGNQAFANHLQEVLHKYHAIYNTNDVVPLAWDFMELDDLRKNYDQWPFIEENINTKEVLVDRWLQWAMERSGDNQYAREPFGTHENFLVENWRNGPVLEPRAGLQEGINKLTKVLNPEDSSVGAKLKSIHDFPNSSGHSEEDYIKNFARFFVQMGLQHVGVYTSSESPIKISKDVTKQLRNYFNHGHPVPGNWIGVRLLSILKKVTDLILEWLKRKSKEEEALDADSLMTDGIATTSFELQVQEIEKIEDESERELAAAQFFEEYGLDSSILTKIWMPFGPLSETEKTMTL